MHIVETASELNPAEPSVDVTELEQRAALLEVGVEIAEILLAEGREVPEHLIAEATELAAIRAFLTRRRRLARSTRVLLTRLERRSTASSLRLIAVATAIEAAA